MIKYTQKIKIQTNLLELLKANSKSFYGSLKGLIKGFKNNVLPNKQISINIPSLNIPRKENLSISSLYFGANYIFNSRKFIKFSNLNIGSILEFNIDFSLFFSVIIVITALILPTMIYYIIVRNLKENSKRYKKLKRFIKEWYKGKNILIIFFFCFLWAQLISYLLKYFDYIDSDLFSYLLDFLGFYLGSFLFAIKNFLKEICGIRDLENIIQSKSITIQHLLQRLRALEKRSKTYDERLSSSGPKSVETIFKILIEELTIKLKELNGKVDLIVAKLFKDIQKKYDHSKGLALEQLLKQLQEDLEWVRKDVENVISLESKNLSEKVKKYIEKLTKELKAQLQIDEETIERIVKKLLEASKLNDDVIDTTLADNTTVADQ